MDNIARIDLIHKRADQAIAQRAAGAIITSCTLLFADENDGEELVWSEAELDGWPAERAEMIQTIDRRKRVAVAFCFEGEVHYGLSREDGDGKYADPNLEDILSHPGLGHVNRGHIMWRTNALFKAARPPRDPYATGFSEEAIARDMVAEGHIKPSVPTQSKFPHPARKPR